MKKLLFFLLIPVFLSAYTPVTVPNGSTLPYELDGDVKVFHLYAEEVEHEFADGLTVRLLGYNGQSPGPVIEAVEGDTVRIHLTNRLKEPTTIHWHGLILPNAQDGVSGVTQRPVCPGETCIYEFPLVQNGTFMYHSHFDDIVQIGMGLYGFFIIHPKDEQDPVDRDFVLFLGEWQIPAGGSLPNPMVMDFNYFTLNSAIYPKAESLVVKTGERVRIRLGNLTLHPHPIHLHGYEFEITRRGGGVIPPSARFSEVTVNVPVGTTRDLEFVADHPGDWLLHCHITHHSGMPGMGGGSPSFIFTGMKALEKRIQHFVPGFHAMGDKGLGTMFSPEHWNMPKPPNFLNWGNPGPYSIIELAGMFTIVKVRDELTSYDDPGWYDQPKGTQVRFQSGSKRWRRTNQNF